MMTQIVSSFIGGLGFSIVFGVRKPYMLLIALNAALSWGVYLPVNSFWGDFAVWWPQGWRPSFGCPGSCCKCPPLSP